MSWRRMFFLIDLFREGTVDLVGLWEVARIAENLVEDEPNKKLEETMIMVKIMIEEGYMVAGDPDWETYNIVPWELPLDEILERIEEGMSEHEMNPPIGSVVYFQTTEEGLNLLQAYGFEDEDS